MVYSYQILSDTLEFTDAYSNQREMLQVIYYYITGMIEWQSTQVHVDYTYWSLTFILFPSQAAWKSNVNHIIRMRVLEKAAMHEYWMVSTCRSTRHVVNIWLIMVQWSLYCSSNVWVIMYRNWCRSVAGKLKITLGTKPFFPSAQSQLFCSFLIQPANLRVLQSSSLISVTSNKAYFQLNKYPLKSDAERSPVTVSKLLPLPPSLVGVAYDCGSVLKKRRSKMNKHKYKKWRKKTKFLRRRLKK